MEYVVHGTGSYQTLNVSGGVTTETTISGLKPSTIYWIKVVAVNSAGSGAYSDSASFRTSGMVECITTHK